MTIQAQLADGRVLEFPDGTNTQVIQSTVQRMIAQQPAAQPTVTQPAAPQAQQQPQQQAAQPEIGALLSQFEAAKNQGDFQTAGAIQQQINAMQSGAIGGALEVAGTIASSAIAEPLAGIAGIGAAIVPGGKTGGEAVESTREALTFQPRTQEGQELLQATGEALQPVAQALEGAEQALGGAAFEATGSPALAAAAATVPTALLELIGVASLRGGAKVGDKIKDISNAVPDDRVSSILSAANKADVPVLTTDLFPPEGFIGKTVQSISEKLGPLGSGSARSSQQRARIEAVTGFADNIDIDTPFADSLVTSLNKKSAKELELAGRVRDQAVTALNEFGDFGSRKAVNKINDILDDQSRLGATANNQLTSELQSFKAELSKASDFSLKKDLRTQLIKKVKAFSRAEDTAPAAELQKVKSALDKDMIDFARSNDKAATRKWLSSNRKFASELDIAKNTEIKRLLQSGQATPEKVIPILRGGKPTELNRLYDSLGQKGRDAAKGALLQQALKDAKFFEVDANPNPDALATALNRPSFQQASKVFFRGKDKAELDGFTRLLDSTRRAQSGQALPRTGEALLLPGGGVALGGAVGSGILPAAPAIAGLTFASGLAKAYESKAFRNLLVKISNTKKGSSLETKTLESAIPAVLAELQAAKTAQEERQQ